MTIRLRFDVAGYSDALERWHLRGVIAARNPDSIVLRVLPDRRPDMAEYLRPAPTPDPRRMPAPKWHGAGTFFPSLLPRS